MPGLFLVTVPGVNVAGEWTVVRDRLTRDFARIDDVLPTTIPSTLLLVHRGTPDEDAWLSALGEAVLARRAMTSTGRPELHGRSPARGRPHLTSAERPCGSAWALGSAKAPGRLRVNSRSSPRQCCSAWRGWSFLRATLRLDRWR
jgi:hypothetical protein